MATLDSGAGAPRRPRRPWNHTEDCSSVLLLLLLHLLILLLLLYLLLPPSSTNMHTQKTHARTRAHRLLPLLPRPVPHLHLLVFLSMQSPPQPPKPLNTTSTPPHLTPLLPGTLVCPPPKPTDSPVFGLRLGCLLTGPSSDLSSGQTPPTIGSGGGSYQVATPRSLSSRHLLWDAHVA